MTLRALVMMTFLILLSGIGVSAEDSSERIARIEAGLLPPLLMKGEMRKPMMLGDRMAEYHAAGVSVAVIDEFEIAWAKAWGFSNADSKEQLTVDSIMQAGSVAKPVAAFLTLQLVADGKVDLDASANDLLESFEIPDSESGGDDPVLVRHLLGHAAGLAPGYFPPTEPGTPRPSLLDQLKGARDDSGAPMVERLIHPGVRAVYSNPAYGILQQMLVDVSGKEFHELAKQVLFETLAMSRSSFASKLPPELFEAAAWGHSWNRESSTLEVTDGKGLVVPGAVGGLWTTPTDLCRLLLGVLDSVRGGASAPLPKELAEEMISRQVEHFGLGVKVVGAEETLHVDHSGGMPGFYAYMIAYPSTGKGAVIMVNGGYRVSSLVHELLQSIAVEYDWPGFAEEREVISMDEEAFSRFVGTYRFDYPVNMDMAVAFRDGRLYRGSMEMLPVSDSVFVVPAAGDELEFQIGPDGEISSFLYGRPGVSKIQARRVD